MLETGKCAFTSLVFPTLSLVVFGSMVSFLRRYNPLQARITIRTRDVGRDEQCYVPLKTVQDVSRANSSNTFGVTARNFL